MFNVILLKRNWITDLLQKGIADIVNAGFRKQIIVIIINETTDMPGRDCLLRVENMLHKTEPSTVIIREDRR
jgi:hypothetical protein